jgi:hypothetical protein
MAFTIEYTNCGRVIEARTRHTARGAAISLGPLAYEVIRGQAMLDRPAGHRFARCAETIRQALKAGDIVGAELRFFNSALTITKA